MTLKSLQKIGAIKEGHFVLTSGQHSSIYVEKFRILENPKLVSKICKKLINQIKNLDIDLIIGPTTGGILIAFEIARQLKIPAIYAELNSDKERCFPRGTQITKTSNAVIVDDVLTTGLSINNVQFAAAKLNLNIVAVGVIVDRTENKLDFDVPLYSVVKIPAKSYSENEIPDWLQKIPITK